MRKPLPNALDIVLRGGLPWAVTPHAGVGLLLEPGRGRGAMAAAERVSRQPRSVKGRGEGRRGAVCPIDGPTGEQAGASRGLGSRLVGQGRIQTLHAE